MKQVNGKQYKSPHTGQNIYKLENAHYSVKPHFRVVPLDIHGLLMVLIKCEKFWCCRHEIVEQSLLV